MKRWPGKRSRTSTHATIVPITAPIAATTSETTSVITSAFTASGLVTESQNVPRPCENAFAATAASGIRTITLRYRVARPRPSVPRRTARPRARLKTRVRGSATA